MQMVERKDWFTSAQYWPDRIPDISGNDVFLVRVLAAQTIERWKRHSEKSDDPSLVFEKLYKENEQRAIGAIAAIVELVNAIGKGESLKKSFGNGF